MQNETLALSDPPFYEQKTKVRFPFWEKSWLFFLNPFLIINHRQNTRPISEQSWKHQPRPILCLVPELLPQKNTTLRPKVASPRRRGHAFIRIHVTRIEVLQKSWFHQLQVVIQRYQTQPEKVASGHSTGKLFSSSLYCHLIE